MKQLGGFLYSSISLQKRPYTMKLVFAIHNQHKLEEVQAIMPSGITLVSLNDINCHDDIP